MSGDPTNVNLWAGAAVYAAFGDDQDALDAITRPSSITVGDLDSDWGVDWSPIGLLDGSEGFTETRDKDEGTFTAWGGFLMRKRRSAYVETHKFTSYESPHKNDTIRRLYLPGSTADRRVVPLKHIERCLIGFETQDGNEVLRLISAYSVEVEPDGDVTRNEEDVPSIPWMVTVFPDPTDDGLWDEFTNAESSS